MQIAIACLTLGLFALALPAAGQDEPGAAAPARVALDTSKGTIVLELAPDKTPKTVANFLTYVKDGHYDGTIFHRVIGGFMIQGGGFGPEMQKKDTRPPIENEAATGLSNTRGTISMARTADPDSATAQFFINTVDNKNLDHGGPNNPGYTAFGTVVEGMDVVDAIAGVQTTRRNGYADVPLEPVVIEKARVLGDSGK